MDMYVYNLNTGYITLYNHMECMDVCLYVHTYVCMRTCMYIRTYVLGVMPQIRH